jgi:hypothetical protein
VIVVDEVTVTLVAAGLEPLLLTGTKVTVAPDMKPVPVIVIGVALLMAPDVGLTLQTVGTRVV